MQFEMGDKAGFQRNEGSMNCKEVTIMKAHGTVMRGYHMPSSHPAWETVKRWRKRVFTRKNAKVTVVSVIGLFLVGLMIWGFYQSFEALNTTHFPSDLNLYAF